MVQIITADLVVPQGAVRTYAITPDNYIMGALQIGDYGLVGQVYYEPNVINYGEMHLASGGYNNGALLYFTSALSWDTGRVENYGLISAVLPDNVGVAALSAPTWSPDLYNAGTIVAEASLHATGYGTADDTLIVTNAVTGVIRVKAAEGPTAISLYNSGTVHNDGQILSHATTGGHPLAADAAFGIRMGAGGGAFFQVHVTNKGLIQATDENSATDRSIAILINGNGLGAITNSGTIRGDYAIREQSEYGYPDPSGIILRNSGLIEGRVFLDAGFDRIINSGRIVGDVDLGVGDDIFDGTLGTLVGALRGGDGNDRLTTGAGAQQIFGGDGADTLDGGAGDDSLDGGAGIDTASYATASAGVTVSLALAGAQATGGAGGDTLTGIENLTGSAFDDRLTGDGAANILAGGLGNDSYQVGAGDIVVEAAGGGTDTIFSALSYALGAELENLVLTGAAIDAVGNDLDNRLTGNGAANRLTGGDGNDVLNGAAGADKMTGGLGDDLYFVDHAGDVVAESGGLDEVRTSLADTTAAAGVETLTGLSNTGQMLRGNTLNNLISGGTGADTMRGGIGNDVYIVGAGDVVVENSGEGSDEVRTALASYALGANLEKLTGLRTTGQILTGNALGNVINGGIGHDKLDGGLGADQLAGGLGNDLYTVDAGDVVIETANAGLDEVRTGLAAYTLGANLEKLTGTSAAGQALTGNSLANTLTGGTGNDVLNGGTDADKMVGGLGNDVYFVDHGSDIVAESGGIDEIRTTLADTTAAAGVENLTGLSNSGQTLRGNTLNNLISGGTGADTMRGGIGNDVYLVGAGDVVIENVGEGSDEIRTELSSYTLGANFEKLTGGAAAQTLTGNDLANVLTGGLGADVLKGAGGNDLFLYRSAAEAAGDKVDGGLGTDSLSLDGAMTSGIAFGNGALASIEKILLASAAAGFNGYNLSFGGNNVAAGQTLTIDGSALRTGEGLSVNAVNETLGAFDLRGGASRDVLIGGSQADTIRGGLGGDHLRGNGGADRFVYGAAAESTGIGFDRLVGFDWRVDKIDLPGSVSGWASEVNGGALRTASFDSDLAAALDAALGANQAVLFRPNSGEFAGRMFAVIDANGDGAYQAGQDYVFEFVAPTVPLAPVTGFFV